MRTISGVEAFGRLAASVADASIRQARGRVVWTPKRVVWQEADKAAKDGAAGRPFYEQEPYDIVVSTTRPRPA